MRDFPNPCEHRPGNHGPHGYVRLFRENSGYGTTTDEWCPGFDDQSYDGYLGRAPDPLPVGGITGPIRYGMILPNGLQVGRYDPARMMHLVRSADGRMWWLAEEGLALLASGQ